MKYQTEYQRNYYPRLPRQSHEFSAEERKLGEVPIKRSSSSPSRRRGRSVPSSPVRTNSNENFAVMGPNDKLSQSSLYRLKQPVKDYPRVAKSQEYALLGRNEKFENNVVYPLRKPVISESPRVVVRRRKKEKHSCGIQTELNKKPSDSYDSRHRRGPNLHRRRDDIKSEYRDRYGWKNPSDTQLYTEDNKSSEQRSAPRVSSSPVKQPSEKTSVAVNTPARVEIDVNKQKPKASRTGTQSGKKSRPKRSATSEYRTAYKPTVDTKQPPMRKAYEAEHINDRKPREIERPERAYSDDEGLNGNVHLGNEFRQKYPHGKLRRWQSEYQSTYKPFWRFDYKDGKWYKNTDVDEKGFNPNLFWYKELMSTRKRADEYRANAEADHFNRDHTLQLQTGFSVNNNSRAWDVEDDDETDSVISIDRDLERERLEGERRRERDAKRNQEERVQYKKSKPSMPKTDQISQTEHQVDRIVYIDDPPPKQPSAATKAFVRNLGSSSVQQHMSWDSESLYTQRTNSDRDSHRKPYTHHHDPVPTASSSRRQESRGTGTFSPISSDRQYKTQTNGYTSPQTNEQTIPPKETRATRPVSSYQNTSHATGRPSYDTQPFDTRPQTSMDQYCTYPASRFKDEVTEYYYGNDHHRQTPVSKPSSYQNRAEPSNEHYGRTYHNNIRPKEDDVLSNNSARSLSSSCSLASQTLERAQQNMSKYWGDSSPSSPSKPYSAKH